MLGFALSISIAALKIYAYLLQDADDRIPPVIAPVTAGLNAKRETNTTPNAPSEGPR
jgi:hypothetical protein